MKAIFFDRDDTLVKDSSYMHKVEDLEFFPETISTLKEIQALGYKLFIVTNQSGIGRGYYSIEDMITFNTAMINSLISHGINIIDLAYCPHTPDDKCSCRKPHPKMIIDLCEKYKVDKSVSYMVGDKISDLEAGENAGVKGVQLKAGQIGKLLDILKK